MKIIVPLVMAGLLFASYPRTAQADTVIWNNGAPLSISTNCDSSPDVCNGPVGNSGWTVYDNFSISAATTITSFTYDSSFLSGSASDYLSTNWSIWALDPITSLEFSFSAFATGNATATLSTDSSGAVTATAFSVSGISVDLTTAGTYWLGYDNVLDSNASNPKTLAVLSNDSIDLPGYEQTSNDGTVAFDESGNTVFTISGTLDSAGGGGGTPTPEPSTWALAGLGLAYLAKRAVRIPVRASGR
jgi:PEP-CTERM motif